MLEGLAVWALFIYLLRLVGMPWNKFSKGFAYIGGGAWLIFVWIGLINYTPMDLSGGSIVQSPHIQLRPGNTNIKGKVEAIHVKPNESVTAGQLIYELDDKPYQIALNQAKVTLSSAMVSYQVALEDVQVAIAQLETADKTIEISQSEQSAAEADLDWKKTTLDRYKKQNSAVKHTITESMIDEQKNAVELAQQKLNTIIIQIDKYLVEKEKAVIAIDRAKLTVKNQQAQIASATEALAQAEWNLEQTKVYAPTDGYVTNFILREGQYVGVVPRIQMYTDEKYILTRVNHQAIRNVKVGQAAEFASPVYPGKVFSAQVEGIVEATAEAQSNLLGLEPSVAKTTVQNLQNKHHFVRLKLEEGADYDIPVGSVGLAWISGEKPNSFMSFLDVIRGIIIRMKAQIYYIYSI